MIVCLQFGDFQHAKNEIKTLVEHVIKIFKKTNSCFRIIKKDLPLDSLFYISQAYKHTHTHIMIHRHGHRHRHRHTHMHTHTCIHAHACIHTQACMHAHTHAYTHAQIPYTYHTNTLHIPYTIHTHTQYMFVLERWGMQVYIVYSQIHTHYSFRIITIILFLVLSKHKVHFY